MFQPLNDRLLIRQDTAAEVSAGGIVIPGVGQERPMLGSILEAGLGRWNPSSGCYDPLSVMVGDRVYFSKFGGVKVKLRDYSSDGKEEELIVLKEGEILGILK